MSTDTALPVESAAAAAGQAAPIGALVKAARHAARRSQLDLALDVGLSTRHLSFVETGRARPSAAMLLALAEALDVPLRARNAWLLAAGYAPRYGEQPLDSARLREVRAHLQRLLDAHQPYPGIALDGHWNVVLTNRTAAGWMALLPDALRAPPVNMMRASLHPQGFAALTRNFAAWGRHLLQSLERQATATQDAFLIALLQEVRGYPNVQALEAARAEARPHDAPPLLLSCELELGGQRLALFSTLTTFGAPRDITLDELCVELFYPLDDATEQALRALEA